MSIISSVYSHGGLRKEIELRYSFSIVCEGECEIPLATTAGHAAAAAAAAVEWPWNAIASHATV